MLLLNKQTCLTRKLTALEIKNLFCFVCHRTKVSFWYPSWWILVTKFSLPGVVPRRFKFGQISNRTRIFCSKISQKQKLCFYHYYHQQAPPQQWIQKPIFFSQFCTVRQNERSRLSLNQDVMKKIKTSDKHAVANATTKVSISKRVANLRMTETIRGCIRALHCIYNGCIFDTVEKNKSEK